VERFLSHTDRQPSSTQFQDWYVIQRHALIRKRLEKASEGDLLKSAEAVVDAALWCRRLGGKLKVSEKTRQSLILAVYRDPGLTPHLFSGDLLIFPG